MEYGILAQLVEHLTFNQVVRGSNPRCLMNLRYYRYDSTFFRFYKLRVWHILYYMCSSGKCAVLMLDMLTGT